MAQYSSNKFIDAFFYTLIGSFILVVLAGIVRIAVAFFSLLRADPGLFWSIAFFVFVFFPVSYLIGRLFFRGMDKPEPLRGGRCED